jgi:hypothetical protein
MIRISIFCIGLLLSTLCYAQDTQISPDDIAECTSVEDIKAAKKEGYPYLKVSGRYYVKVGGDYKGPYRSLEFANNMRKRYMEEAQKSGVFIDNSNLGGTYNPRLIIFPFTAVGKDKNLQFQVPGDTVVSATNVMIHPEPLLFDDVQFGLITLPDKSNYFAATGNILFRENIKIPSDALIYHVGAAVLDESGNILWKTYGTVEDDKGFKCLAPVNFTTNKPFVLLLFTLGHGKIKEMLTPSKDIPTMNAEPYSYHILCSSTLEMGPNWFPPIQEMAKEEYNKLMEEETQKRIEIYKKIR